MNFNIDKTPPSADEIASEQVAIKKELQEIRRRDTIISSLIILIVSIALSVIVYLYTENVPYALITATVIPVAGSLMALGGLVSDAGFRSAAHCIITLNNRLFALEAIAKENFTDVEKLAERYEQVQGYIDHVATLSGRGLVNGELAMFWEWDATTMGKTSRAREYMENAKRAVDMSDKDKLDEPQFDI